MHYAHSIPAIQRYRHTAAAAAAAIAADCGGTAASSQRYEEVVRVERRMWVGCVVRQVHHLHRADCSSDSSTGGRQPCRQLQAGADTPCQHAAGQRWRATSTASPTPRHLQLSCAGMQRSGDEGQVVQLVLPAGGVCRVCRPPMHDCRAAGARVHVDKTTPAACAAAGPPPAPPASTRFNTAEAAAHLAGWNLRLQPPSAACRRPA